MFAVEVVPRSVEAVRPEAAALVALAVVGPDQLMENFGEGVRSFMVRHAEAFSFVPRCDGLVCRVAKRAFAIAPVEVVRIAPHSDGARLGHLVAERDYAGRVSVAAKRAGFGGWFRSFVLS